MATNTSFYNIGINYNKADISVRSKFSLSADNAIDLLREAKTKDYKIVLLNTCNRTEIFGFADNISVLVNLLCKHTVGTKEQFLTNAQFYEDNEAIEHLFKLGTGLESQIIGDFEIIGQLKSAFSLSKKMEVTNSFLDRIINHVVRTSKVVKNKTEFSTAAASTAYAAVRWIKEHSVENNKLNITLFGTGDIGKVTCANLVKYFPNCDITLVNRTREKADFLSQKFEVKVEDFSNLNKVVANSDVLIVATNANSPTITDDMLTGVETLSIIDLSVPCNVDVTSRNGIKVVNLDDLIKVVDATLEARRLEIPKVLEIIKDNMVEFEEWMKQSVYRDSAKAFKQKLIDIQQEEIAHHCKKIEGLNPNHVQLVSDKIIQKITKDYIKHLKQSTTKSEDSINLINEIFNLKS